MSATLVLDEKYNNQKTGLCFDSGFPQIADNSDTSCLGIGGRRLSAFDLIYCDTILGQFRICILYMSHSQMLGKFEYTLPAKF